MASNEEKEKRVKELEEGLSKLGMKLVRGTLDRIYELSGDERVALGKEVNRRYRDLPGKSIKEIEEIYIEVAEDMDLIDRIQ